MCEGWLTCTRDAEGGGALGRPREAEGSCGGPNGRLGWPWAKAGAVWVVVRRGDPRIALSFEGGCGAQPGRWSRHGARRGRRGLLWGARGIGRGSRPLMVAAGSRYGEGVGREGGVSTGHRPALEGAVVCGAEMVCGKM